MKHIIVLGDGMADLPVERLGGKTLLQYASKPMMDRLAKEGRCGRLITVPEGFPPGSEVANTAILGYDLNKVYEGRGPLEAASIGYEMADDDLALRCNIINLQDGKIITHNGGNKPINQREGCERVKFITGIQYRHLLVIKGGNKHITCAPPHDHPNEEWRPLLVKPDETASTCHLERSREISSLTAAETADLLNELILKSQELLPKHPYNQAKAAKGEDTKAVVKTDGKVNETPGEVFAAIGMALHDMQNDVHDIEDMVLTIQTDQKVEESAWSNKAFAMRQMPIRK